MKKILLILIVSIIFVFTGCSKPKEQVIEEKIETATAKEEINENEEVSKEVPQITDDDIKIIQETVKKDTIGSPLEGLSDDAIKAEFYIGKYTEGNVHLKIYIEKPISELKEYWNEDVSGVVKKIRNSFVFDIVKTDIKGKLSYNEYSYITVEYAQDGEMYTMQGIRND